MEPNAWIKTINHPKTLPFFIKWNEIRSNKGNIEINILIFGFSKMINDIEISSKKKKPTKMIKYFNFSLLKNDLDIIISDFLGNLIMS